MKKTQKYGLIFEEKAEKCEEMLKTHHIYLEEDPRSFTRNDKNDPHILIEGENLHALKILTYTHAGKIDIIYIDPPYNTGNKDFVYNDDFVDKEDGFKHSKWLSFMAKRLEMAKKLLSERGVIFLSIDDNEMAQLKLLCNAILGEENFVANLIWKKKATNGGISKGGFGINVQHEYVLMYAKQINLLTINGVPGGEELDAKYNLQEIDGRKYRLIDLAGYGLTYQESLDYEIADPQGKLIRANDVMGVKYKAGWRWSKKTYEDNKDLIVWVKGKPKTKTYMNGDQQLIHPSSLLDDKSMLANTDSSIKSIFEEKVFDYAKPVNLIKHLLSIASKKDSIILDFFAGSGTTGQAVAELNKEDGGTRQFILCTNNDTSEKLPHGICSEVTFPRLEKTIGEENLKVFKIKSLRKAHEGMVSAKKQMELYDRLLPILCLNANAFRLLEEDGGKRIFINAKGDRFLGILSHSYSEVKPVSTEEMRAFIQTMKTKENFLIWINKAGDGYAGKYVEFMK